MRIALTGATGFVGSHLLDHAVTAGHEIRALTRRPQPDRPDVRWIAGSLDDEAALAEMCDGAETVVHVAGVLNARDMAAFDRANVGGTRSMITAAQGAGVRRFVHVSSLAAREPHLSHYGASKARSETVVRTAPLEWAIVRPPAVFGPGDRETLDLFKMAKSGFVAMPAQGRASYIHVGDLARLLLALAESDAQTGLTIEPDDGRPGGWTHADFVAALGRALGGKARALPTPRALLSLGASLDRLVRGDGAKLTQDRVSYFSHPDWTVDPARAAPAALWSPQIATEEGLASTAEWYRSAGWL